MQIRHVLNAWNSKQAARLLERDLSDEMYHSLAERWFTTSTIPKEVDSVSE